MSIKISYANLTPLYNRPWEIWIRDYVNTRKFWCDGKLENGMPQNFPVLCSVSRITRTKEAHMPCFLERFD